MNEIKEYYFALYLKAILNYENDNDNDNENTSSIIDDLTFYEKRFFCAHLYNSTYEKMYDCEELALFAKYDIKEENDYISNNIKLNENEWIEDICDCKIIVTDPDTGKEVDGVIYLENKGFSDICIEESGITKFSSWCDKSDLP